VVKVLIVLLKYVSNSGYRNTKINSILIIKAGHQVVQSRFYFIIR